MLNSFWWGSNRQSGKGIKWLWWDRVAMRKEYGGMGFRNLYGFNLAILGKQGWKLATNHDTIVSRVFKAKYFPRGNFIDAKLGHNPSFIWRSIHASQVVVKGGLRWRIGDGQKIRVGKDPWIRNQDGDYVFGLMQQDVENMKVAELIDNNTGPWKRDLLNLYFNQHVVNLILSIPILKNIGEDKCAWRFTSHGEYTVKSGYHYIMERLVDNSDLRVSSNWMKIWNMKIPQKVKVFLWRAARGCLPTRERLLSRGVQSTNRCVHCEGSYENDWHIFFECHKVEEVWVAAGLWNFIKDKLKTADGFVDLFFQLFNRLAQENLHMFAMTMWCIWKRRNEKLWNDVDTRPEVSVRLARESLYQWQQVRLKQTCMGNVSDSGNNTVITQNNNTNVTRWRKPALGEVKCNVDAAIFKDQRCYDVGMCLRGGNSEFIAAKTDWFQGIPQPQEA